MVVVVVGHCFRYERCSAQFDFVSVSVRPKVSYSIRCGQLHNDNDDCDSIVWRTNVNARHNKVQNEQRIRAEKVEGRERAKKESTRVPEIIIK